MTSEHDRHVAPPRMRVAGLRTPRGKRVGRFGLYTVDDRTHHHWEWLEAPWPATPLRMVPDPFEPAPAPSLSETYAMPPDIHPLPDGRWTPPGEVDRIFGVIRIDDERRHLATLVVVGTTLHWLEVEAGGVLEIAPGWLAFEPRDTIDRNGRFTRRLTQRQQPRARQAPSDPDTFPLLMDESSGGGMSAYARCR